MTITSQIWTRYPMEDNPLGVGTNYTVTTFIDHLIDWFSGTSAESYDLSQWTISDSGTDGSAKYLELKPPASGSINPDDRVLIWGGDTVNASALSDGANGSSSYIYVCYAPNAGTTGFDVSPNTGDPYTGVISSKMIIAHTTITTYEKLDVYMSNDVLCINTGVDGGSNVTGLCFVGRAFNPVNTANQYTLIAGQGKFDTDWSQQPDINGPFWPTDLNPTSADIAIWVQESSGDVAWTRCYRVNLWAESNYKNNASEDKYFFKIELGENDAGNNDRFLGYVLFARGGPADAHGQTKSDGSVRGYSISPDEVLTDESTYYLWNE